MGNLLQQLALLGALMLSGEQGLGRGLPMGLQVPSMGLMGDDGGRVQTGVPRAAFWVLSGRVHSLHVLCASLCFTQSHVPAWAMCCQCTVSLYPCVPVSACLCHIYDHVSLHTLGPCVHVCSVCTATYVHSSTIFVSKHFMSVSVSVLGLYLCLPLCLCPHLCPVNV